MTPFKSVSIIGYGAVGSSLADFFVKSETDLHSVWDRKPEVTLLKDGNTLKPAGKPMPDSADETGELIILSVPDKAIAKIAEKLSLLPGNWTGKWIAHVSGSLPAQVLDKLKKKGASVAAMHPLQTFTGTGNKSKLQDIRFTLQGDGEFLVKLKALVGMMGSSAVEVDEKTKLILHLSAVFASNYMVSLLDMAKDTAESSGVDNSLELLAPIINATLQNVLARGTEQSLSGPAARGDSETISRHLDLLKDHSELLEAYKVLGSRALQIAGRSGNLSPEKIQEIKSLFEKEK